MDIFEQVKQMAREEGLEEGRKEGLVEGQQEGLREGLREGLKEGLRKGLRKGEQAAKENFIRQLVNDTEFSDDKIASLVGCALDQVAAIRKQLNSK